MCHKAQSNIHKIPRRSLHLSDRSPSAANSMLLASVGWSATRRERSSGAPYLRAVRAACGTVKTRVVFKLEKNGLKGEVLRTWLIFRTFHGEHVFLDELYCWDGFSSGCQRFSSGFRIFDMYIHWHVFSIIKQELPFEKSSAWFAAFCSWEWEWFSVRHLKAPSTSPLKLSARAKEHKHTKQDQSKSSKL